jgi:hypothetical protein
MITPPAPLAHLWYYELFQHFTLLATASPVASEIKK